MYTNISDEFKQIVSSNAVTAVAKIVFTSPNITISGKATGSVKSSIQDVQITDNCYDSGKLIGTAMTKEVEIKVINKDNLDLADKEFELFVGVKLSNGEYEYIPYGKYIITTYEDTKSNNIFKIIAYDYMFKLNKELKEINFNPSFPISLKNFREQLLTSCGIGYKEQQLANDNFIVNVMPNFDGISVRNVLGKIAELQGTFAKINRNNKMQFYLKTETSEQIGKMSMNSKLEINKRFGPVNSVALALKNVEGENVTKRNEQSIVENGETMITITDNPFVYTEGLRESAITELFNALDGFSYYPTKFNYKARLYTDCGDGIEVENVQTGNFVSSIILNQHIKIPATRQSSLENPALSNTAIQNQYISQSKQENTHTELLVDKQNQKIESVISQVGEQNSKISQITQTVDELNSKIGEVADVTITGESYNAQVFLEGINASEPILIKIRPYLQSISALYPSKSLFPGNGVYPRGKPKLIFFDRDNNNMWTYMLPDNLNYIDENTYDEFLLDYENQICSVTKRVGIDENGALYKLDIPYSTQYDYPTIALEDGNYSVYLDTYNNGYLFVKLMSANIYTSQFATKVELNSEINQTKSEIDLSVSEKLTGYPTTTEMNSAINVKAEEITSSVSKTYATKNELTTTKSEIKVTTDGISSEVSKKVGNNEIISKINQSAEAVTISANKFNINGTVSANGNFKVDTNGNMIANNGTFNGGVVNVTDNGLGAYEGNIRATGNTFTNGLYSEGLVIRKNNSPTNRVSANSIFLHMYEGEPRFTMTGTSREIARITNSGMNFMFENDVGFSVDGSNRQAVLDGITNFYSTAPITVTSLKEAKKNFEKLENALDIVKATDIYKYNLKNEEDTTKKHIGFVIGDNYNYSEEITSKNNDGVDIYSMVSVCMKAIQEQQETIEKLQQEIKELKGEK